MRNTLVERLPSWRRLAVGIDLTPRAIRVLILSRARIRRYRPGELPPSRKLRVEHIGSAAMPEGAMAGTQLRDVEAIGAAIYAALQRSDLPISDNGGAAPREYRSALLPGVLGLPSSIVVTRELSSTEAAGAPTSVAWMPPERDFALDALAPSVLAEAERITGIERAALAVDWLQREPTHLSFAATQRHGVDLRVEAAALGGVASHIVECESAAARRACKMALASGVADPTSATGIGLWQAEDTLHLWRFEADGSAREIAALAWQQRDGLGAVLRDLGAVSAVGTVVIAGEADVVSTVAMVGDLLGCRARIFDPADCCVCAAGVVIASPASWAVAFGLALRGLM